jgi:gliding-associated putative ABC transporter substrate-binding component GldG
MQNKKLNATVFTAAVLGALVFLNLISVGLFGRMDLTREGIFTLADASRTTMESLEEVVTVTAYFTEDLPAPYSGNSRYVKDLLDEYRAASGGKLVYEFVDPAGEETAEDKAKKKDAKRDIFGRVVREQTSVEKELTGMGIQPVEIRVLEEDKRQTKRAWMGIAIRSGENQEVIPVVQQVGTLEYDLTSLIRKMTRPKVPVLGLVHDHAEPKVNKLRTILSQLYEVRDLNLHADPTIADDVDAIMVVGPEKSLPPPAVAALDAFVKKGGSAAFFVDRVHVDTQTFQPTPVEHGLNPLLASYGIEVGENLVGDVKCADLSVQEQRGFMVVTMPVKYPFVPMIERLEGESAVSRGIAGVILPFASPVKATGGEGREVQILARSSGKSWLEGAPYNINPRRDWGKEQIAVDGPHPLLVQISGDFGAPAEATADGATGGKGRVMVAGTSAFVWDTFFGGGNQALALNIVDWLLLDPALLKMRTRGMTEPPIVADLSDVRRNTIKYGNMIGVPFLLAMFGVVRWRMREGSRRQR